MNKNITFSVDSDVLDKFCLALNLTDETQDFAIEKCMKEYISKTFARASHEYDNKPTYKDNKDFYGKANSRIPIWAIKPNQYNHKIIRAYFKALELQEEVTIENMRVICSDKNFPDVYVPTFMSNYAQMKLDGPKTHGKVFEDNGYYVAIWEEVLETLNKYKTYFID